VDHLLGFVETGQIYYSGCTWEIYEALENLYYVLLMYFDLETGALTATIGGPPDDALTAMALGFMGKSDAGVYDDWLLSNMTEFLWARRTGNNSVNSIYYNPANPNSMPAQTTELDKLLVRSVALIGLSAAFEEGSSRWSLIESDLQNLFITAFNHTTGCGHAEELYYIGLAVIALNNHERFNNVSYLSGFFQNYMDDYGQFPSNETT